MAKIMSVSVDKETMHHLAELEKLGFSGRSDIVRQAIHLLHQETQERSKLCGELDAILLVVHDEESREVSEIRHHYQKLIQTQLHHHLKNHKCLEILILRGDATLIQKMVEALRTSKRIRLAKLVTT